MLNSFLVEGAQENLYMTRYFWTVMMLTLDFPIKCKRSCGGLMTKAMSSPLNVTTMWFFVLRLYCPLASCPTISQDVKSLVANPGR